MKILVTGGTGRIGANLVKQLLAKGHEIRSFVYPGDTSRVHKLDGYDGVETILGDLRNDADVKEAVRGVEAIYHLASRYLSMPYNLTKWIGEELVMTYHYQYGVPSTAFRFSTVTEPSEVLNEAGLPTLFLFSPLYELYHSQTSPNPEEQAMLEEIKSLWTGSEQFMLCRNPDGRAHRQHFCDVRDIAQGLVLGLEKEEAVGQEFTLAGAIYDWGEIVPVLAERYQLDYVEARLPLPRYFEFDLSKIQSALGYQPQYDFYRSLETTEAMRRGESTEVIPTGIWTPGD